MPMAMNLLSRPSIETRFGLECAPVRRECTSALDVPKIGPEPSEAR
jgi:hypothetical protein